MHNNFVNKKRRNINFREAQVENILPEHFAEYYPKFIALLKRYYEFQDQNDSTELLNHLFAARDINETDITLLSYIEDELLLGEAYFKGFGNNETELRAAANFSNILFRSKGTKFAIEWFFRSFYGEDVEVLYPKENVFKIGEIDSLLGPDSLKYLTDDKLYQTFSLLIRVGIPIQKWKEVFKLFAHPAGMYLGGEVFLTDENISQINTLSEIFQFTSTSWQVNYAATTMDEGQILEAAIVGSNVQNDNIDVLYWYGKHITTNDSDFALGLPDSNNPQYIPITNDNGFFSIETVIDPLTSPVEGTESFEVYVVDRGKRIVNQQIITLNDILPTYTLSTTATAWTIANPLTDPADTSNEGTEIEFTVTVTNPPFGGNETLYWYIDAGGSSATQQDFDTVWPTLANPQSFEVTSDAGNSGSFTIASRVDGTVEVSESYLVKVINKNGVEVISYPMFIVNVSAILNVLTNNPVEGNNLTVTVGTGTYNIGKYIDFAITGSAQTDGRLDAVSGQILITGVTTVYNIATTTDENYTAGGVSGTITLTDNNLDTPVSTNTTFSILDGAPVYTITATPAVGGEGDTITYTVGGENIPDGDVYFYIDNAPPNPTSDADWTVTPPRENTRQTITVSGGTGTFQLTYATNGDTDDENYVAYLYDDPNSGQGTQLAETFFTISANAINVAASTTTPNEGDTVTFTVTGITDGTYQYRIQGVSGTITSSDFNPLRVPDTKYDFTVASGTGEFDITLANDLNREGTESFQIIVNSTDIGTPDIGSSSVITVSDTSISQYSVAFYPTNSTTAVTTLTEGTDYRVGILSQGNQDPAETLYIELSGPGAAYFTSTQATQTSGAISTRKYSTFTAVADDGVSQGSRDLTVTITLGDYNSGSPTAVKDQLTVNLTDGATNWTLVVDPGQTLPIEEGDSIVFDITSTSVADGTKVYYRDQRFYGIAVSMNNTSILTPLNGVNPADLGITVGMIAKDLVDGIPGVITSIATTSPYYITMQYATGKTSSNANLMFALPSSWDFFDISGNLPYGEAEITSNAGTFTVDTQASPTSSDYVSYMAIYPDINTDGFGSGPLYNYYATANYTITDATGGASSDWYFNPLYIASPTTIELNAFNESPPLAEADVYIRFNSLGQIEASTNGVNAGSNPNINQGWVVIGTFASGGSADGWKIRATKTDVVTSGATMSSFGAGFGVDQTVTAAVSPIWGIEVTGFTNKIHEGLRKITFTAIDPLGNSHVNPYRVDLFGSLSVLIIDEGNEGGGF